MNAQDALSVDVRQRCARRRRHLGHREINRDVGKDLLTEQRGLQLFEVSKNLHALCSYPVPMPLDILSPFNQVLLLQKSKTLDDYVVREVGDIHYLCR